MVKSSGAIPFSLSIFSSHSYRPSHACIKGNATHTSRFASTITEHQRFSPLLWISSDPSHATS
jgi:hypothetical protein